MNFRGLVLNGLCGEAVDRRRSAAALLPADEYGGIEYGGLPVKFFFYVVFVILLRCSVFRSD
jgi:hypothetical protein